MLKSLSFLNERQAALKKGPSYTVCLRVHKMADRKKSLRRNMPSTGIHNGRRIWRAQNQSAGCQPAFCQTGTRLMSGFPCGQNAVCFEFVWRWAARADSNQIKNNLHVIQSANIPVTIIGLTFVPYSICDLLSEPDKGPLLISFRNVDNKRTQSDVWLKQAAIWRYWMFPFDVRCTLRRIRYSKHPCHRADAAASLTTGPKTRIRSPISRGLYNKGSW